MFTLLAMVHTFVSKEGNFTDVLEDPDSIATFAVERLIDDRSHLSNVYELLDPARGTPGELDFGKIHVFGIMIRRWIEEL